MCGDDSSSSIEERIGFPEDLLAGIGSDGVRNNNRPFGSGKNLEISESFAHDSIKRSRLFDSRFIDSDFSLAAATGSRFVNVDFDNCRLYGANFQNCDFIDTVIHANEEERKAIDFCHFGQSTFVKCNLDQVRFYGCSFHQTVFWNTHFMSAEIMESTLEGAEFIGCQLSDMSLSQINLDFSTFLDCHFDKVGFEIYQVPYVFGLLDYLLTTDDKVWLTATKDGVEHRIEVDALRELFPQLERYFYGLGEFFPLANMMLVTEDHEKACEYLLTGIKKAIEELDFRMVEYYAQLATQNSILSMADKKRIYTSVEETALGIITETADMHRYLLHKPRIREILLDDMYGQQALEISFDTSIPADDFETASKLGKMLNSECERYTNQKSIHRVELRHSSDFQIGIFIVDNLPAILSCLSSMMGVVLNGIQIKKLKLSPRVKKEISAEQKAFMDQQKAFMDQSDRIGQYIPPNEEATLNFSQEHKHTQKIGEFVSETVDTFSYSLSGSALKYLSPQDIIGMVPLSDTLKGSGK